MAKIIEREDEQASTEDVFAEQQDQPEVEEQVTPSEPEIPDKYQGKSAQELVHGIIHLYLYLYGNLIHYPRA